MEIESAQRYNALIDVSLSEHYGKTFEFCMCLQMTGEIKRHYRSFAVAEREASLSFLNFLTDDGWMGYGGIK